VRIAAWWQRVTRQPEPINPTCGMLGAATLPNSSVIGRNSSGLKSLDNTGAATLPHVVIAGRNPAKHVAVLVRSVLTAMDVRDGIRQSPEADVMMVAISGQEAAWIHRDQVVTGKRPGVIGPATGLWQFERGGGVAGVLRLQASAAIAMEWCRAEGVGATPDAVWRALVTNDRLACVFARLLLLTDPRALTSDQDAAWDYYIRNWRPGKPHMQTWPKNWAAAQAASQGWEGVW